MNTSEFLICFILLAVLLIFLNMKHWNVMSRSIRRFTVFLYIVTFVLYAAVVFGYQVPMPTRFFIDKVSPWVFTIIHPD
ncbi:hypothetical protein [Paenibacillus puerhi]|uniref:hypothetical protein n=1 Tax=Paenibacillus puerhi TaxID=2692622 RepID=UPI00135C1293|nr:hypothetical protein [Paenibacillus puerhi]